MKIKDLVGWQKRKLLVAFFTIVIIGSTFLGYCVSTLYNDKAGEDEYWSKNLTMNEELSEKVAVQGANATKVTVGSYIENLKEINIKGAVFRGTYEIWFRWEGDPALDMMNNFHVYKGSINSKEVIKDYHEDGVNYQLIRADISVTKNFWTRRFPLESHQLRMYLESTHPIEDVVFVADKENSGYNGGLSIAGFELRQHDVASYANQYANTHNDPQLEEPIATSEFVTAIEINREGFGLYIKCFIALVGTITWVMIALFICTYHHVDPLGMIPAALFGTVTNIMVGANLLPDALQTGLLEYVNAWGIMIILCTALSVININRIRSKNQDKEFASFFGRTLFFTILFFIIVGNVLLPLVSYMW